jgi:hypothetical protein
VFEVEATWALARPLLPGAEPGFEYRGGEKKIEQYLSYYQARVPRKNFAVDATQMYCESSIKSIN